MRVLRGALLGLRLRRSSLCIDPVLPPAFDGLVARIKLEDRAVAATEWARSGTGREQ